MPSKREQALDRKKEVTGETSNQTRALAAGLLIFLWAIFTGTSPLTLTLTRHFSSFLLLAGMFEVMALFCDFFQYIVAHEAAKDALERASKEEHQGPVFNPTSWVYKAQTWFFNSKIICLLIGSALIALVILLYALSQVFSIL
jgi:hypothetical protein